MINQRRVESSHTPIDPRDTGTWPVVMTPEQIAAIFQRPILGLKKACQQGRFQPAPFQRHPYRWRRADVIRVVEGSRGMPVAWKRGA